jgi:16S rRNA processing protein RimM
LLKKHLLSRKPQRKKNLTSKELVKESELIPAGVIVAAHGLQGHVRVKTFTEIPAGIDSYGALSDETGKRSFILKVLEARDTVAICRVSGSNDRNAAEKLKGQILYLRRSCLPDPDVDEYFHADLIGLNVLVQGSSIGKVNALFDHGAGDLIEIALSDGGPPLVLPFTRAVVPVIDVAEGTIEVDPPSGLWVPKDVHKGDE